MKHILSLSLFLVIAMGAFAQSASTTKSLCSRKWITSEFQLGNQKFSATDVLENDGTVFLEGGTLTSVDNGVATKGKWSFDENSKVLTTQNEGDKEPSKMLVRSISESTLVLETMSHESQPMTIYFKGQKL
jgi:hypothetical protein